MFIHVSAEFVALESQFKKFVLNSDATIFAEVLETEASVELNEEAITALAEVETFVAVPLVSFVVSLVAPPTFESEFFSVPPVADAEAKDDNDAVTVVVAVIAEQGMEEEDEGHVLFDVVFGAVETSADITLFITEGIR